MPRLALLFLGVGVPASGLDAGGSAGGGFAGGDPAGGDPAGGAGTDAGLSPPDPPPQAARGKLAASASTCRRVTEDAAGAASKEGVLSVLTAGKVKPVRAVETLPNVSERTLT